jgi:hypothetical protein
MLPPAPSTRASCRPKLTVLDRGGRRWLRSAGRSQHAFPFSLHVWLAARRSPPALQAPQLRGRREQCAHCGEAHKWGLRGLDIAGGGLGRHCECPGPAQDRATVLTTLHCTALLQAPSMPRATPAAAAQQAAAASALRLGAGMKAPGGAAGGFCSEEDIQLRWSSPRKAVRRTGGRQRQQRDGGVCTRAPHNNASLLCPSSCTAMRGAAAVVPLLRLATCWWQLLWHPLSALCARLNNINTNTNRARGSSTSATRAS